MRAGGAGLCPFVYFKIDFIHSDRYIPRMYSIQYTSTAAKALKKAPADMIVRILQALQTLAAAPFNATGVKKLSTREGYRLRVGDWRVLYSLDNDILIVLILDMGHRKEVYK